MTISTPKQAQAQAQAKSRHNDITNVVDVVLLTLKDGELHVALVQRTNEKEPAFGLWALPGGFIRNAEDVDTLATAERVLREKAGLQSPYLEQLAVFSGRARDPDRGWTLCVAYCALVSEEVLSSSNTAVPVKLVNVRTLRGLPFDHKDITEAAVERVRTKCRYSSMSAYLCPAAFTLPQLHTVYQAVRGVPSNLDSFRRTFIDMIEDGGIEEIPGAKLKPKLGKPAQLYRIAPKTFGTLVTRDRGLAG